MSIFKQQREQVRINILDTAVSLFREKGYENVTIDEITKSVDIAKGTFYNFFPTKSDILFSWAVQEFGKFDFTTGVNPGNTILENLESLADMLAAAIEREERLFKHFIIELLKYFGDKNFEGKLNFLQIFSLILRGSKDSGSIGHALLEEKADMLNSTFFLGIVNWFNQQNSANGLRDHLHKLIMLCLFGIMTNYSKE